MWINGINWLEKLLAVSCLLNDKSVIHISEPQPGWIRGSADGLGFKLLT